MTASKRSVGELYKFDLHVDEAKKQKLAHEDAIKEAQSANHVDGERGMVQCAPIVHFRAPKGLDKRWPVRHGYRNINVCSSGVRPFSDLSPMFLGPVVFEVRFPVYLFFMY